jgi:very-short-patch-repair endonuclease
MKSRLETTPEKVVRHFLDSVGANYIQEYKIGRFWADFYLPDYNAVIEVDGDYWHSLPSVKEKDTRKDKFLKLNGIIVIHIKECELRTSDVIIERWQNLTGQTAVKVGE